MDERRRSQRMRSIFPRGVAGEALGYGLERMMRLLISAAVMVFVARYLGPADYGLLSYAAGIFGLLAPVALLGVPQVLVREMGARSDWPSLVVAAIAVQLPVAIVAGLVGLVVVVATRSSDPRSLALALSLAPLPLMGLAATYRIRLEFVGDVRRVLVSGISATLVASAMRVACLMAAGPLWLFGAATTVELAVLAFGYLGTTPGRPFFHAVRAYFDRSVAGALLRDSWPLLVSGLAVTVYMKADIVMLGMLASDTETGVYAAASRLSEVWYFVPISVAAAVRPRLARMHSAGASVEYTVLTQRFLSSMTALAVAAVVLIFAASGGLIQLLYGESFIAAASVLRVHILAAPFVFLTVAANQWFIDRRLTRILMVRSFGGASLNVVLNLVLIPTWGALGAAVASLIAYGAVFFLNGVSSDSRPVFLLQLAALRLRWYRDRDAFKTE